MMTSSFGAVAVLLVFENCKKNGSRLACSCALHRIYKTCIVAAFILVRIERKGTALNGNDCASEFGVCQLRIAAGSPFADGDAGAVGLHDCAHDDTGGYHSAGLRSG